MAKLIGFTGPIGSGKDTLARALQLHPSLPAVRILKFADPLYDMATAIDPTFSPDMSHAQKDDWLLGREELGTRRNFLEKLGTEFGRQLIHKDLWLEVLMTRALAALSLSNVVLVTDVRFPNEAAAIREAGGYIVHLRPDWPSAGLPSKHLSAQPLPVEQSDIVLPLKQWAISEPVEKLIKLLG